MKLIIVSTTIHGEKGYLEYDKLASESNFSEVKFIIAGDLKSKPFDASKFKCDVEYLTPEAQKKYHSSELIGWNKIARRNIAMLRAIELNPDYTLTIDDDNRPSKDYFEKWHKVITSPVNKIIVPKEETKRPHWHNYLATADAKIEIYPRGYPIPFRDVNNTKVKSISKSIDPDRVGLFQGISLGDPDIDAITRIVYSERLPLKAIREKDYCLKDVWAPYNTQNTVLGKKLIPLLLTWPLCGRMEDIYISYMWQKLLFNNDMYVHVGEAVNFQDRGVRNPLIDLGNEVEGYFHSHEIWREIDANTQTNGGDFIRQLIKSEHPIIQRHKNFFLAFLKDLDKAL